MPRRPSGGTSARWDGGWWTPFDHRELRDDRVVYRARVLWKGTYTVTYVARATTPGTFVRPPVLAEEMYNPAVYGRSDGGVFTVEAQVTMMRRVLWMRARAVVARCRGGVAGACLLRPLPAGLLARPRGRAAGCMDRSGAPLRTTRTG